MKRIITFLLVILLTLSLAGCGRGNIRYLETTIGDSDVYTREDIEKAIDVVSRFFQKEFEGCTLRTIEYNEPETIRRAREWAEQYDAAEAIVLLSSFTVGIYGSDGSLNPGDTYTNWQWILTRNSGEAWTLQTWGYG